MKTIKTDRKEPAMAVVANHPEIGSLTDFPKQIRVKKPRRGKAGISQTRSIIFIRPKSLDRQHWSLSVFA